MNDHAAIGARVQASIPSGVLQRDVAGRVDMTPDSLSRALRGQRNFSSLELAGLAAVLDVDLYWLVTGDEDPLRIQVAARHTFDRATNEHSVPGRSVDEQTLNDVALAYRQAYPEADYPSSDIPAEVAALRLRLGDDEEGVVDDGFVRTLADRVEERLDIDVVRIQGLSTDYSFSVGGRRVILLATNANWFRSNWSLAHELAHLVLDHHMFDGASTEEQEIEANKFAADLLLPRNLMCSVDWMAVRAEALARFVWDHGVSNESLRNRLSSLGLQTSSTISDLLAESTQSLLRRHLSTVVEHRGGGVGVVDVITDRMRDAAARRFPKPLVAAHVTAVAEDRLSGRTLAWMLETDPADISDQTIPHEHTDVDDLAAALGLSVDD